MKTVLISVPYGQFKRADGALVYVKAHGNYYLTKSTDYVEYSCVISDDGADAADFEANLKPGATALI